MPTAVAGFTAATRTLARRTAIPLEPFCHRRLSAKKPLPVGYPAELKTIGDHVRKRRLDLGLLQDEAAHRVGTKTSTIANWERERSTPRLRAWPGVLAFLAYDPRPAAKTIGEKFRLYREGLGLSKEELAGQLSLDPGTLQAWEKCPDERQNCRSIPVIARFIGNNPFDPPETDAERVKQRRLLLGLTQEQLGKLLGVREAVVLEWERGRRSVPVTVSAHLGTLSPPFDIGAILRLT